MAWLDGLPLNGLRAFEAAARSGSFALARKELHVTQASGKPTGSAAGRAAGLRSLPASRQRTGAHRQARAFQPGLTDAFNAIERLTDQVTAMRAGPVLTVGVAPAFALHWLIPRLADFNRSRPESRCAWPPVVRGFHCVTIGRALSVAARRMTGPVI